MESPHDLFRRVVATTGDRIAAIRTIRNGKGAVVRDIERARLDQAAFFGADLHQLCRVGARWVNPVNGMAAAIEDVVIAVGDLLEANRLAEESNDIRGKAAY
jgi:hypothetical protein